MSQRIKTEPPWLAKTVSPDFGPHIWTVAERIIGGNGIGKPGIGVIDIDPQHFAEQNVQILTVALWILLRPGVTHANVEKTIGPKGDAATGMILRDSFHLDEPARGRS